MKKIMMIIGVLFSFVTISSAQVDAASENGPKIVFEKTTHDFGKINYNGNGTYEFVFRNIGNEPLILSQPKSSCGCTVPEWPKKPILPGETDVIRVTYKNTNKPGSFNKYVTIFSNAKNSSEVKLYIKGNVLSEPKEALPAKDKSPMNTNR